MQSAFAAVASRENSKERFKSNNRSQEVSPTRAVAGADDSKSNGFILHANDYQQRQQSIQIGQVLEGIEKKLQVTQLERNNAAAVSRKSIKKRNTDLSAELND